MNSGILLRKLKSAKWRAEQLPGRWKSFRNTRKQDRAFEGWLHQLEQSPPDVLVGSNFAEFGGVRNHIQAIRRFSSLSLSLAPSEELLETVTPYQLDTTYRETFFRLNTSGIKAAHSHVFPWFIEWCRHQQIHQNLRWIHTYHLHYFPEHGGGSIEPWQDRINQPLLNEARYADVKLSVSKWQQRWLREEHEIDSDYLPNGVDVPFCDLANPTKAVDRFGSSPYVLYVGRNDPVKNPADFVRLAIQLPGCHFVMMGRELSSQVIKSDWNLDAPGNLTILGDASHSDVQDAMAGCAALVVTSFREGLPTVVLEGMTHAKSVVVPNEEGCMEAIGGGEFGFVYEQGNIDDLVAKVETALSDQAIGNAARRRVLDEYDWRVIAPKLDQLYAGEMLQA